MGLKSLEAAVEEFGREKVEVFFQPYIIDPNTKLEGEEYLAYNQRRWGSDGWTRHLREKGREVGAPFKDWQWWPNTLKAHCLIRFAEERGIDPAKVKLLLFEALYEEGQNLSEARVLAKLAKKLGLPEEETFSYLESGAGEKYMLEMVRYNQQAIQGAGVPTFIVEGGGQPLGFSGAMPAPQILGVLQQAHSQA